MASGKRWATDQITVIVADAECAIPPEVAVTVRV
jgi:hypothetical protein